MASVISKLSGPFGLPRGPVLLPGKATDVAGWDEIKEHQHIKHLLETKAIEVVSPLDHDKDGKKGGSTAPEQTDELADLRAQYADLYGKRPFMGWDAKTLTAKIDEKLAE